MYYTRKDTWGLDKSSLQGDIHCQVENNKVTEQVHGKEKTVRGQKYDIIHGKKKESLKLGHLKLPTYAILSAYFDIISIDIYLC